MAKPSLSSVTPAQLAASVLSSSGCQQHQVLTRMHTDMARGNIDLRLLVTRQAVAAASARLPPATTTSLPGMSTWVRFALFMPKPCTHGTPCYVAHGLMSTLQLTMYT